MRPEDEIVEAELLPDELQPLPEANEHASESAMTRKSLVEQVLSPHALQWMMICGGGMLILGFVIWLWSVGIFENPIVVASVVGAATMGTLAAGVAMVRLTRYQLAGRGIAMLGSIALPLNLWLYDGQGLVTLADGGHLWIPAALCCLIYAGVARVLRDSTFVYALVGGVVMTGMLFLADETIGRFWTLVPPVTFLVVIGWIITFAERLFNEDDSDFSRKNFGLAFHRAGLAVVASGLALLLGGHLFAFFKILSLLIGVPAEQLAFTQPQQVLSLVLITGAAIGFGVQSWLQSCRSYSVVAVLLSAWAIPVTLAVFSIHISLNQLAIVTAVIVVAGNVWVAWARSQSEMRKGSLVSAVESVVNDGFPAATIALIVVALGQLFTQSLGSLRFELFCEIGWASAIQVFLTACSAIAVGWNLKRSTTAVGVRSSIAHCLIGVGGVLVTASVWTAAVGVWGQPPVWFGLASCLIPLAIASVSVVLREPVSVRVMQIVAAVAVTIQLPLIALVDYMPIAPVAHLSWGFSLLIASAVYFIASRGRATRTARVLGYVSLVMSLAIGFDYLGVEIVYASLLAPVVLGVSLRVFDVLTERSLKLTSSSIVANSLVLGSSVAGSLLAMNRWLDGGVNETLLGALCVQLAGSALVSVLSKSDSWRLAFRASIVATLGSLICVFDGVIQIDGWQRLELCSVLGGLILLVLGHMTWMREDGQTDDAASISLATGSLLVAAPLAVGLLVYRFGISVDASWMQFHEVTAIAAALVLFGSGVLCRLRATTISGAGLLGVYLLSLLLLIRLPDQLQNVSVMMMVGGGIFFATALLMSIYRDRLMSLPQRIREGEGVYQILKWR